MERSARINVNFWQNSIIIQVNFLKIRKFEFDSKFEIINLVSLMYSNTKNFARQKASWIPLPNLVEAQVNSNERFLEKGLKELFDEISPIRDYTGKELELSFLDYYFDEPKFDELHAKEHGLSFEAPLRAKVRLANKKTGEIKEQEVYLGDFPLMTRRGTFAR